MRREGYEFQVSRPEVITREIDGKVHEPIEHLVIDTTEEFVGTVSDLVGGRRARLTDMVHDGRGGVRLEYAIPTRGLIGLRNAFLTATRGNGVMASRLIGYEPWQGPIQSLALGRRWSPPRAGTALEPRPGQRPGAGRHLHRAADPGLRGDDRRPAPAPGRPAGQRLPRQEADQHARLDQGHRHRSHPAGRPLAWSKRSTSWPTTSCSKSPRRPSACASATSPPDERAKERKKSQMQAASRG